MNVKVFEVDKIYEGEASHVGINPQYVVSFIPVADEVLYVTLAVHKLGARIKCSFTEFYDWLLAA